MRNTRRPAWPVVFLLATAAGWAADSGDFEPVERLAEEIQRWRRIRRPEGAEAFEGFERAYEAATARWVARWPGEELAWRERLRALAGGNVPRAAVEEALAGAEAALGERPGMIFPEDTRFLMAEAAVRHGVQSDKVRDWLEMALESAAVGLPQGNHSLEQAYRRERLSAARWRAAGILAELAYRRRDGIALEGQIRALAAEGAAARPDPADRVAVAECARRRMALRLWRARLAKLRGDVGQAKWFYGRALEARPVQPAEEEPVEHGELIEEAAGLGVEARAGTPIPPAASAGPHWLPTAQRLDGFEPDGRPAVAVIWDGESVAILRAIERLRARTAVRIVEYPRAEEEWIRRFNPLYTAAQLWIVDGEGVIRLVGRLQPGGDGWEDAVAGAALRAGL